MEVTLSVLSGTSTGGSITVRTGQVVRVGNSSAADLAVSDDRKLAEVHFSLTCDSSNCYLRVTDGAESVIVNEDPVVTAVVKDGDRISAGGTLFELHAGAVDGPAAAAPAEPREAVAETPPVEVEAATPATPSAPGVRQASAIECRKEVSLDGAPAELAREGESGLQLLDALVASELHAEAVRVMAYLLPKPTAIQWALDCIDALPDRSVSPGEAAAAAAARQWLAEPEEERRREAQAAAEAADFDGAGCWVAMGVFWSGGSIAPPDQASVPPVDNLTAQAVSAALTMAAVAEPAEADGRYKGFVERGKKMMGALA